MIFAGMGARIATKAVCTEVFDMPEEDAEVFSRTVGFGVSVATFDAPSTLEHLEDLAEFVAQGDWHP